MSDLQDLATLRGAYYTEDVLAATDFPEPRWAVPGLVAEGLTILAGAPKLGKSWMALSVALGVASGTPVLGSVPTTGGDVLYLALEDTPRRLKSRLSMLRQGTEASPRLTLVTYMPEPDNVLGLLDEWLSEHPDARLIVVDVFAKIRTRAPSDSRSIYSVDYEDASNLKALADRHRVAIVLVHHTRKMGADDAFDTISGSTGLTGAADTSLVLKRARNATTATLHVTGRDVSESEYALTFDPTTGRWRLDGNELADAARKAAEVHATASLDVRSRRMVEIVNAAPEGIRADDVADMLGDLDAQLVGTYLARLAKQHRIARYGRGLYGRVESVESVESDPLFNTFNTFNTPTEGVEA